MIYRRGDPQIMIKTILITAIASLGLCMGCGNTTSERKADVRPSYEAVPDDPATTNDESNDQPVGHFGTHTIRVRNIGSGNNYPLDAEIESNGDGYRLERLYFPKGGRVRFIHCELDADFTGTCRDASGGRWDVNGLE